MEKLIQQPFKIMNVKKLRDATCVTIKNFESVNGKILDNGKISLEALSPTDKLKMAYDIHQETQKNMNQENTHIDFSFKLTPEYLNTL